MKNIFISEMILNRADDQSVHEIANLFSAKLIYILKYIIKPFIKMKLLGGVLKFTVLRMLIKSIKVIVLRY